MGDSTVINLFHLIWVRLLSNCRARCRLLIGPNRLRKPHCVQFFLYVIDSWQLTATRPLESDISAHCHACRPSRKQIASCWSRCGLDTGLEALSTTYTVGNIPLLLNCL